MELVFVSRRQTIQKYIALLNISAELFSLLYDRIQAIKNLLSKSRTSLSPTILYVPRHR